MYKKQKKIPTIIALTVIFLGIFGAVYLENTSRNILTSAKSYSPPQEIHVTNISDSSLIVSYLTADAVFGSVQISDDFGFKQTFFDDLDSDNIPRPRKTHLFTARNLKEDTAYKLKIVSGNSICTDEKCPVISTKTTLKLKNIIDLPPAHGQIFKADGTSAEGAIVYLQIGKALPIVSRCDSLGIWVIPLNNLRSQDLITRPEITDNDLIQITAKINPIDTATSVIDVKSIRQNLPVPKMEIGKTYNFISLYSKMNQIAQKNSGILGADTTKSAVQNPTPQPTLNPLFDIAFPRVDMDSTPDKKPRLRGVAKPGSEITVTVLSSLQKGKIKVDNDGNWVFQPPDNLEPGIHTVKIEGYDKNGKYRTLTKKFVVLKSGESILGESTPSASLTPTPSTATPTTLPATPSATVITPTTAPSATPTLIPTGIPTVTPIQITDTPPRSGNATLTTVIIGSGAVIFFLGLKFLLSL